MVSWSPGTNRLHWHMVKPSSSLNRHGSSELDRVSTPTGISRPWLVVHAQKFLKFTWPSLLPSANSHSCVMLPTPAHKRFNSLTAIVNWSKFNCPLLFVSQNRKRISCVENSERACSCSERMSLVSSESEAVPEGFFREHAKMTAFCHLEDAPLHTHLKQTCVVQPWFWQKKRGSCGDISWTHRVHRALSCIKDPKAAPCSK
mmetsp:Transcript_33436/g.89458  ORF Transcript_33436/g.89458 Transcript_33436/m.89458 type:complete len:202 (+) Transcript_33436:1064-1669(+)